MDDKEAQLKICPEASSNCKNPKHLREATPTMTLPLTASITAHPRLIDWLTLAGLVVAWGSSFAMTKIAVGHLDAAWVMALRLTIGGIFLLGVLLISERNLPAEPRLWRWFVWLGLIGHAVPFFLISWGTQFVSSGLSGVLMGAIPLFVIVLAHFFLPR